MSPRTNLTLVLALTSLPGLATAATLADYANLPLAFERNIGQAGPQVHYLARGPGYTLLLSPTQAVLRLKGDVALAMNLVGANSSPRLDALESLPGTSNYLLGNDPARWRTGIPHFARVRYRNAWPGVDILFYGSQRRLEYDLVVSPGADPRLIQFDFAGARELRIDPRGDLVLHFAGGEIRQHKPLVYQEVDGVRRPIQGSYVLTAKRRVAFRLAPHDPRRPLIIDPVLSHSSYLGGSGVDSGASIAVDSAGNAYVAGSTLSANLPTLTPVQAKWGGNNSMDAFVAKINPSGSALVYATYLGGSDYDIANGIAVDGSGNAYVVGTTASSDFPTVNPFQERYRGGMFVSGGPGGDAFVAKLNPTGGALVYSTYLGGSLDDFGNAIAVDPAGNAFVAGYTESKDFPLQDPLQGTLRGSFAPGMCVISRTGSTVTATFCGDAFVTKLNASGRTLVYSTFLGGNEDDRSFAIAVDSSGSAYVSGVTESSDFPTASPAQPNSRGGADAFVARLNPNGAALVYSTYLGGSLSDSGRGIAVDPAGNAYVAGATSSTNFPSFNGPQSLSGGGDSDAYVTKLSPTGTLLYSTYLGGSGTDSAGAIAVDAQGNACVVGTTSSTNFPTTPSALQSVNRGNNDAFVTKLAASGSNWVYSSYLGGTGAEGGRGIALDAAGNAYLTGATASTDFPTARPFQAQYAGPAPPATPAGDAFITRIDFVEASLQAAPNALSFLFVLGGAAPPAQELQISSGATPISFTIEVSGGNWLSATPATGTTLAKLAVSVNPAGLPAGVYNATIRIASPSAVNSPQTVSVRLTVSSAPLFSAAGVVNAASFLPGPIAPGEIVTIFGIRIGPDALVGLRLNTAGLVDNILADTRVLFDGVAAPLIYVSSGQLSCVVPYSVAGKTTTQVQIEYKGERSTPVSLQVAAAAPAIFTADSSGKGNAAILNQDGAINSPNLPAEKGSVVVFYATGEGETDPPGVDGQPALAVFPKPKLPVWVRIGGIDAQVLYAGAAPGLVAGVLQVNARIPDTVTPGAAVPLLLTVGTLTSRPDIAIAIR